MATQRDALSKWYRAFVLLDLSAFYGYDLLIAVLFALKCWVAKRRNPTYPYLRIFLFENDYHNHSWYTSLFTSLMNDTMRITEFSKGERVRLLDYGQTDIVYKRRLLSLGLTKGTELTVIRLAPFGCPVQVEVRGTFLTLRKEEARELLWEKL